MHGRFVFQGGISSSLLAYLSSFSEGLILYYLHTTSRRRRRRRCDVRTQTFAKFMTLFSLGAFFLYFSFSPNGMQ
jgi:hypothetical protein